MTTTTNSEPQKINLMAAAPNAAEIGMWRATALSNLEPMEGNAGRRWLFLLRRVQSDTDREALGLPAYRSEELVQPPARSR